MAATTTTTAPGKNSLKRKQPEEDSTNDDDGKGENGAAAFSPTRSIPGPTGMRQQYSDVPLSEDDKKRGVTIDILVEDKDADAPRDGSARPKIWSQGVVAAVDKFSGMLTVHVNKHGKIMIEPESKLLAPAGRYYTGGHQDTTPSPWDPRVFQQGNMDGPTGYLSLATTDVSGSGSGVGSGSGAGASAAPDASLKAMEDESSEADVGTVAVAADVKGEL